MSVQTDFYNRIRPEAQRASKATGIPVQTIMAQWALESDYGRSNGATKKNNYAGIMADGSIKSFSSLSAFTDAYIKSANNPRYNGARTPNPQTAAIGLGVGGWDANKYRPGEGTGAIGGRLVAFLEKDKDYFGVDTFGSDKPSVVGTNLVDIARQRPLTPAEVASVQAAWTAKHPNVAISNWDYFQKLLLGQEIVWPGSTTPTVTGANGGEIRANWLKSLDADMGGVVVSDPISAAVTAAQGPAVAAAKTIDSVPAFLAAISNPALWRRIGIGAAGAVAIIIGGVLVLRIQTKGKI